MNFSQSFYNTVIVLFNLFFSVQSNGNRTNSLNEEMSTTDNTDVN